MLPAIKHKFISLLQLILVLIYILFEELIWEGIARPIYDFIHSLKILHKVEEMLHAVNAYVILVVFVVLLGLVEALGIYAGILFVSGQALLGMTLYITKIPIAAFTFWMFRITEDKLMQFGWFKWIYDWIMKGIDWLKSLEVYQSTMQRIKIIKESLKQTMKRVKEKYFAKESPFLTRIKHLYQTIKDVLRKR